MTEEIKDPSPRLSCALTELDTSNLLRTDLGDIDELVDSLRENIERGLPPLIHPVVVDSKMRLLSGSRRLEAHRRLGLTVIDYTVFGVLSEAEQVRIEVDANKQKLFNWKEKCLGIAKYHDFYSTQAALKGESWGVRETSRLLRTASKSNVNRATFIATYIRAGDPDILAAESLEDAYRVLVKRREEELSKQLVKQSAGVPTAQTENKVGQTPRADISDDAFFSEAGTTGFSPGINMPIDLDERPDSGVRTEAAQRVVIPLSTMFRHADAVAHTKTLPAETFDAVITDWPYGIEMSNIQQDGGGKDVSSTAAEHDVDSNLDLQKDITPELFRVLKPNGWFITWTDMSVWGYNVSLLTAAGFKVQRWPLIWHKTSTCQNMAAQFNYTKNYEIAIVARKGNATLLRSQASSVWQGGNDAETRLLGHPFAKPAGLWEWLYNATCLRGALVYDPFVGSGSSVLPAIRMGLRPMGCESNEKHFGTLNVNLMNFYKSLDPNCDFS